jgi:hypothetical protein
MGFKVDNQKVWDEVKSGDLDGLYIEAYLVLKKLTIIKYEYTKEPKDCRIQ